jgi:hypothetical protein
MTNLCVFIWGGSWGKAQDHSVARLSREWGNRRMSIDC